MEKEKPSSRVTGVKHQDGVDSETDLSAVSDSDSISEFDSNSDCTDFEEDERVAHHVELVSERGDSLGQWSGNNCK